MNYGLKVVFYTFHHQDNLSNKLVKKGQIFLALFFINSYIDHAVNFKLKDIGPQLITVLAVVLVFGFFTYNAQVNMENRGIDFGYGFLSQESSFDVQFSQIEYDGSHSYFRAYLVGLLNTILVSVIGIILATILGVLVLSLIHI